MARIVGRCDICGRGKMELMNYEDRNVCVDCAGGELVGGDGDDGEDVKNGVRVVDFP